MTKTTRLFLVLALLALLPTAPALAGGEEGGQDDEKTVEKKVHRVMVAPVDGEMHVLHDAEDGEHGDEDLKVRVFVRKQAGGEDGETRTFTWTGEDGEVTELDGADVFFVPGAERGFLGVQLTDLTPELRRHFGAKDEYGVLVASVVEDSPAARAGLKVGDVLTHVDGEPVGSSFEVTTRIGSREAGDVAALEVLRDGKVDTFSATLETRERRQIEVGRMLRHLPHLSGEGFAYEFDPATLELQMEKLRGQFDSPEWKARMEEMSEDVRKRLEELDVEIEGLEEEIDVDVRVEKDGGEGGSD